jgi:hypothetical protein
LSVAVESGAPEATVTFENEPVTRQGISKLGVPRRGGGRFDVLAFLEVDVVSTEDHDDYHDLLQTDDSDSSESSAESDIDGHVLTANDSDCPTSQANFEDWVFTPAAFRDKYDMDAPVVQATKSRPLRCLIDSTEYWIMNMKERTLLYAHWQDEMLNAQTPIHDKRFTELRREHAAVLSELEEVRDLVSSETNTKPVRIFDI